MLEELLVIFMQGIRCIYNHQVISHVFCTYMCTMNSPLDFNAIIN